MIMIILLRHIHDRYEKPADNVVSSNGNTKIIILILRAILLFNGSLTSRLCDRCRGNGIKVRSSGRGHPICSRQTLADGIGKENVPLYVAVIAADNELHMVSHRSETFMMQTSRYNIHRMCCNKCTLYRRRLEIRNICAEVTKTLNETLIELSRSNPMASDCEVIS